MRLTTSSTRTLVLAGLLALPVSASLSAQPQDSANANPNITVYGQNQAGPEIKGLISARNGDKIKVTTPDGNSAVIQLTEATKVKAGGGLFGGGAKLDNAALLNGLPVTVKTWQTPEGLIANQITFGKNDLKFAKMIRHGTQQQFDEQTAATEALRGRMGDIDKYNIKGTTNVNFDTGKWQLTPEAKATLCQTAAQADQTDNALMLVVGYTDSVGSDEYNQTLSEKRASTVINYLQQACHWKPYRMLTPTGMAKADPLASNDTPEGKAQNRRVSVNILVSKAVDVGS